MRSSAPGMPTPSSIRWDNYISAWSFAGGPDSAVSFAARKIREKNWLLCNESLSSVTENFSPYHCQSQARRYNSLPSLIVSAWWVFLQNCFFVESGSFKALKSALFNICMAFIKKISCQLCPNLFEIYSYKIEFQVVDHYSYFTVYFLYIDWNNMFLLLFVTSLWLHYLSVERCLDIVEIINSNVQ